jgi:diketogulonate reductase-like aldo/keto reductase
MHSTTAFLSQLGDYVELKTNQLPLVNQIEINPFLPKNTIELFQKDGVVLQSYRALRDKAFDPA